MIAVLFLASTCSARVEHLPEAVVSEMKQASWHEGCPVALADLRLVRVPYVGFDGENHDGELVVHQTLATDVGAVFCALFDARFPIERMRRIDAYGGDDDKSMADNNTSAFNCRVVPGKKKLSNHAYGAAVDVNPGQNPYITPDGVMPKSAEAYLDRRQRTPGLIVAGDACHAAFVKRGFAWGGRWKSVKDYQHFERPLAR